MQKVLLGTILLLSFYSCKKQQEPSSEEVQNQQISDVIPQRYLDTLTILGLAINKGTTPPNVEGLYQFNPWSLRKSNIAGDVVGQTFAISKLKLSDQSGSDFTIKLLGKNFVNTLDSSLVTAVSGSGNDFTVYGKIKSTAFNGIDYAIFAIILSGTKDGTNFRNVEYGLINIDNSHGGSSFIKEGQARVIDESDNISETPAFFRPVGNTINTFFANPAGMVK